ncbi:MAG: NUDIX domain-containing protein [Chitinophagaceae bacterium]|nr:MAG: NUDIX domain-containing protein [Chitinophagaceae bacterium]
MKFAGVDKSSLLCVIITQTELSKPFDQYNNPALAVDLVIFGYQPKQLSVLLLNRKEAPFEDGWVLPGAFLQPEETFRDVCVRILDSKLGIGEVYLEQLFSFDEINRDPRGRVISITYYALINPASIEMVAGSMANDVSWHSINKIPVLGFDHTGILQKALERLQAKILYFPVGFELLNEEFTITELQDLYECILGISIDRRNFRRKILESAYIIPTGNKRAGLKNRHPDLYRFNRQLKPNNFHLNINVV